MTATKVALLALLAPFVPHLAAAQVPLYPNANVPSAPTTLDPGESGSQAPEPPPPPAAPAPAQPSVVVVKPDGTMQVGGPQPPAEPSGYYADSGEGAPADQPQQGGGDEGPIPEVHQVRRGDTLWDICQRYFNDPWQWPKIWSYNPQITNPHWIYPGDYVRLLPRGQFATQPETGPAPDTGPTPAPSDNLPPPERRSDVLLRQTAFVEKGDLDSSMKIDGSVDEKVLLGLGDSVYLSYPKGKPPQVGQRYSIYTPDQQVNFGGKDEGAFVHILGAVEVASVKEDKQARAVIIASDQEIERGDLVGPLVKEFKSMPPTPAEVDAQGAIVAMLAPAQLIGQGELVFVDLGAKSGIKVGNRMVVVRRGDALPAQMDKTIGQDDSRYPARELGEVMIVQVGKNISAGLVTVSVQEMGVGDLVLMQKAE